jgi:hypothetical protein
VVEVARCKVPDSHVAGRANVLIFERLKEELRTGRTLGVAVETGFNRAWPAIRDSNITTIIACIILYWVGSSLAEPRMQGFALVLLQSQDQFQKPAAAIVADVSGDKAKPREIWERFPKFILGYIVTFTLVLALALGATPEFGAKIKAAIGATNAFRGIFFG